MRPRASSIVLLACICWPRHSAADEGFWLFSAPPRVALESRYGFAPDDAWLRRLMMSSAELRIGPDTYVSGAFVSRRGLFLTAFHVGSQVVEPQHDSFASAGFLARTIREERKLPGVVIRSLVSITDVTDKIERSPAAEVRAQLARLEAESTRETGLQSRIVTLWGGAKFELYRYATYTDVRLVFCPEASSAIARDSTTGQELRHPDSFHFDVCLFRVYEDGKPAQLRHHLEFSGKPAREAELVLVSGSPIASRRLPPAIDLQFERDVAIPLRIARARELEFASTAVDADAIAEAARAERTYWQRQRAFLEAEVPKTIYPSDEPVRSALERASHAAAEMAADFSRYYLLEEAAGFDAELFDYARVLVRNPLERASPDHERQPMYAAANWQRLDGWMRAHMPVDLRVQEARLHAWLSLLTETLGDEDPAVQRLLAGLAPRERARELVTRTRVGDIAFRAPIWTGAAAVLDAARDPMLDLVRSIESEARNLASRKEGHQAAILQAQGEIALARSKAGGMEAYPEASSSLRLSYGVVQGYGDVPAWSTFGHLRAWMDSRVVSGSSALSPGWMRARHSLTSSTPFNVATTADVIGGSSGSAVVNREGRLLGIMRGMNDAAPLNAWTYGSTRTRSIYVAAHAIVEGLRKIYGAHELADELTTSTRLAPPRGETPSRSPRLQSKRGGTPPESRALP